MVKHIKHIIFLLSFLLGTDVLALSTQTGICGHPNPAYICLKQIYSFKKVLIVFNDFADLNHSKFSANVKQHVRGADAHFNISLLHTEIHFVWNMTRLLMAE